MCRLPIDRLQGVCLTAHPAEGLKGRSIVFKRRGDGGQARLQAQKQALHHRGCQGILGIHGLCFVVDHQQCIRALHGAASEGRHGPRAHNSRRGRQIARRRAELAKGVRVWQVVERIGNVDSRFEANLSRLVAAERKSRQRAPIG